MPGHNFVAQRWLSIIRDHLADLLIKEAFYSLTKEPKYQNMPLCMKMTIEIERHRIFWDETRKQNRSKAVATLKSKK